MIFYLFYLKKHFSAPLFTKHAHFFLILAQRITWQKMTAAELLSHNPFFNKIDIRTRRSGAHKKAKNE